MIATGALDRAVNGGLTIDRVRPLDARRTRLGLDALDEIEQQLQVAVSGTAGSTMAWSQVAIVFDVEFLNATDQRYSNLTIPHFTHGVVLLAADTVTPVLVTAVVRAWTIDTRELISGATVAVGAVSPGTTVGVPFDGHVHLTFQGYGALADDAPSDVVLS